MEEVDGRGGAREGFPGYAGEFASLASNGHVEGLVALFTQLLNGNVLSYFHAGAYFNANLAHYVNLGLDYILLKLI